MKSFEVVILLLAYIIAIVCLIIYYKRYSFIRTVKLELCGILIANDIFFKAFVSYICNLFFPSLSTESLVFLAEAIMLPFDIFIILLIFHKQHTAFDKRVLIGFGSLLSVVWVAQFYLNILSKLSTRLPVERIHVTLMFESLGVVTLILSYYINLFKHNFELYTHHPFFWIATGWLIYFVVIFISLSPEVIKMNIEEKRLLEMVEAIVIYSMYTLVAIGFWKSKSYVQYLQHI